MLTWISIVGVLARIQLLRVISCCYVSCGDQERALRDLEATTFCVQEPAVGFAPGSDQIHKESGTSKSALEEPTNLSRTESPRQGDRNKSDHEGGGTRRRRVVAAAKRGVGEGRGGY
ncbi:hypothetical protein F511_28867 [Dorcoceras hygrometricum]|uniref:Secreted protein n=1 Tax=Dorcoceras hygrometricum TaxID=472368 RepID=A0A2Z7D9N5_9LAMI|nr:hypothetical protein F511_28867 [Dorcoceras hygrometricum]